MFFTVFSHLNNTIFLCLLVLFGDMLLDLMWLFFGEMIPRCYDDRVHVDEESYPALNDESNPVLKNKKVSTIRFTCDDYVAVTVKAFSVK